MCWRGKLYIDNPSIVEKEETINIDLQEAVTAFAHIKTRRYPLILK